NASESTSFCLQPSADHRYLHSFPTRRSSDLEKWMSAQMLVTPNDRDLLNSYVADFYTPENQEKIRQALVNLLKVDTSFDTYIKRSEEHTSELQSRENLVCRLLLEKKKNNNKN